MRVRLATALAAGFAVALGVATFPASAADAVIAAQSGSPSTWSKGAVTIYAGESVTWSTDGGRAHNVCVQKPGTSGATCDEFQNGPVQSDWSANATNSHQFIAPGAYHFFCQAHPTSMTGTITVQGVSSSTNTDAGAGTGAGTGTSTYPPAESQPTDTTTTQTEAQPAPRETTAPGFTRKLKRRSSRKAVILEFGASENATLQAASFRRPLRGRSFKRISQATLKVKPGKNVVTVLRTSKGSLRKGAYRIELRLVDAAGNKSATKTFSFKLA
jgi:plastocyanin